MPDPGAVDLEMLAYALSDQGGWDSFWLFDPRTGRTEFWSSDDPDRPDLDDDEDLADDPRVRVEPLPLWVWYQDMVDFAAALGGDPVAHRLERALQGRGAFRRFRDVLHDDAPHLLDGWRAFEAGRAAVRAVEWLRDNRFTSDERYQEYAAAHPDPDPTGRPRRAPRAAAASVRVATPDDLAAVQRIFGHYVVQTVVTFAEVPPTVPDWERRLTEHEDRGLPFLVAEADGAVVGYAYASPWRPAPAYRYTVEDTVYVDPDRTGLGIGGLLLGTLLARLEAAGLRQVIAVVADDTADPASGAASTALHRRFGFTEAGRLTGVGFKHGRRLDTVLLQRSLD